MAFYLSDNRSGRQSTYELFGRTYADPHRKVTPTAPRNPASHGGAPFRGTITGRWDPNLPYMVNLAQGRSPTGSVRYPGIVPMSASAEGAPNPLRPRPVDNPFGVNQFNFENYNQGINDPAMEGRGYIGGFPDDYVSRKWVDVPYGSDNLSLRYYSRQKRPVFGKPIYREGMEATFAGGKTPDQIAAWQGFFQIQGFKTGPRGFWTKYEMDAMRAFMSMANGTPGGGMTVDVLRERIMNDPAMTPGSLSTMLSEEGNELAADGSGGGGDIPLEEQLPYTTTTVERNTTEASRDEAFMAMRAILAREWGRAPTESEVGTFMKGLNAAFRADPSIITTVVTTNPATGQVDQERTSQETGVDPGARAETFALEANPEERQEFKAGRFFDVLRREVGL